MKRTNIYCLIILILSLLSSCSLIKNYKEHREIVEFEYDYSTLLFRAPDDYCLYDEKVPLDSDVIKILKTIHGANNFNLGLLMQNCVEKKNFSNNNDPHFRDILMITFPIKDHLQALKKYSLERSRDVYLEFVHDPSSLEELKAINKRMKYKILPQLRKDIDQSIIDDSKNLTPEQKKELKLTHDEVFGNSDHIFTIYDHKLDPKTASYDYQEFLVGDLTVRCVGADTLINYAPINFSICRDKESGSLEDIKRDIKKYVKQIISLNNDDI